MLILLVLFTVAAFMVGVVVGPTIHKFIEEAQKDSKECPSLAEKGKTSCFPKTIIEDKDFWTPPGPKPKRKRKGK